MVLTGSVQPHLNKHMVPYFQKKRDRLVGL